MQRREFLGAVAGVAVAAATPPAFAQAVKKRLKQGLWKVNFGADTKLSFDEECAIAKRLGLYGFDVIPTKDWPTLDRHGLKPLMVGPGDTDYLTGLIHPEAFDRLMTAIPAQVDLCAKEKVRCIGLTAGQRRSMDYKTAADNAVEICKRLAPKFEASGVLMTIENVNDRRGADADLAREDMVFGHWDWGLEVVERVNSPAIKLLCDIYHLQIMDGDITYRIKRDIQHIGHIHVAGVPQRKEIDGRQELNWRMIAQTIADTGYDGYVCHEWRLTPGHDAEKAIAEAVAIIDV